MVPLLWAGHLTDPRLSCSHTGAMTPASSSSSVSFSLQPLGEQVSPLRTAEMHSGGHRRMGSRQWQCAANSTKA